MSDAAMIEVPKPASTEQVKFFVDNGYLVMPGLVSAPELEELKADTYKIARGGYPCSSLKPLPSDTSDADCLRNVLCIHQPHFISDVAKKFVHHAGMCGVLSQVAAAHLPFWDGSVKCMQSMLFVKPPGFQGQAWHQDEIYIPTRDRSLVGAWIAIDDATIDNGCLYVVPGSHRQGYLYPQKAHDREDIWDFAGCSYGFDDSRQVPVEVKAGSVVFFNGYLLHCSYPNRTKSQYRRVLVNHYMNAYSLLPWHPVPGVAMAQIDVRKVVPVAGIDPYAWKGYDDTGSNEVWLRTCKANKAAVDPAADHRKGETEKAAIADNV